jgi:D-amino peptidase
MKIYVMVDMEGLSGIRRTEQVKKGFPEYDKGCKLMMREINEVVDALFDSGATEVVVRDTHLTGGQVEIEEMDPRAVYELSSLKLMPSLDASFDGVILLGHHTKAGILNGFLDHTMNPDTWFKFELNGVEMGEIGIEAAYAGHFDVPVIMVSGDEETIKEANETLGTVAGAVVKWGLGRNYAKCLSLDAAYKRIRDAVKQGMGLIGKIQPFKPALPATAEITFSRSDYADIKSNRPGTERVDARKIRVTLSSLKDLPSSWC